MADSVKIKITGDDSDFRRTLGNVGQTAAGVFKGMLGSQLVTAGVNALTNGLRGAITTSMQFEAAMDQVAAISGATGAELDRLTEAAKHYGETTMFSASQAAEALNYMALAGWDVQQSLDALPGVLDLAAASGMALGAASDAVTDYLSAFGMEASKAGYMADLMAYAQSRSNTSAIQLSDAYGNCATSMHAAGQDIETTTAMLMSLANQGIKGSEAGTQMAAVMRDLTQKMENGQIMIGKTAVKVTDAEGNFRDLNDIIMDVGKATEGMGTAEQSAAIMTTFTARSVKAIQTLLNEGVENVNQYEEALRGSEGTAADQAKTMMDNLQGDVKIFQSALEGVQITAGEAMNDSARAVVQMGTDVMEAVNQGGKTNGLAGMADAFIKQIPKLMPQAINGVKQLIAGIGQQLPGLMQSLFATLPDLLNGALDLAPVLLESLGGAVEAAVSGLISNLPSILSGLFNSLPEILTGLVTGALRGANGIYDGIQQVLKDTGLIAPDLNDVISQAFENADTSHIQVGDVQIPDIDVDGEIDTATYTGKIETAKSEIQSAIDGLKLSDTDAEALKQALISGSGADALAAALKALNVPQTKVDAAVKAIGEFKEKINKVFAEFKIDDEDGTIAGNIAAAVANGESLQSALQTFAGLSAKDAEAAADQLQPELDSLVEAYNALNLNGLNTKGITDAINKANTDLSGALQKLAGLSVEDAKTTAEQLQPELDALKTTYESLKLNVDFGTFLDELAKPGNDIESVLQSLAGLSAEEAKEAAGKLQPDLDTLKATLESLNIDVDFNTFLSAAATASTSLASALQAFAGLSAEDAAAAAEALGTPIETIKTKLGELNLNGVDLSAFLDACLAQGESAEQALQKLAGLSPEEAKEAAEGLQPAVDDIRTALTGLNLEGVDLGDFLAAAMTANGDIVAALKLLGMTDPEITMALKSIDLLANSVSLKVQAAYDALKEAFTNGKLEDDVEAAEDFGESIDEAAQTGHEKIDTWLAEYTTQLGLMEQSATEYETALNSAKEKAESMHAELDATVQAAKDWATQNAGAKKEEIENSIGELQGLIEQIEGLENRVEGLREKLSTRDYAVRDAVERGLIGSKNSQAQAMQLTAKEYELAITEAAETYAKAEEAAQKIIEDAEVAYAKGDITSEERDNKIREAGESLEDALAERTVKEKEALDAYDRHVQAIENGMIASDKGLSDALDQAAEEIVPKQAAKKINDALTEKTESILGGETIDGNQFIEDLGITPIEMDSLLGAMEFDGTGADLINQLVASIATGGTSIERGKLVGLADGIEGIITDTVEGVVNGDGISDAADVLTMALENGWLISAGEVDYSDPAAMYQAAIEQYIRDAVEKAGESTSETETEPAKVTVPVEEEIETTGDIPDEINEEVEESTDGAGGEATVTSTIKMDGEVEAAEDLPEKIDEAVDEATEGAGGEATVETDVTMEMNIEAAEDTSDQIEEAIEDVTADGGSGTVKSDIELDSDVEVAEDTPEKIAEAMSEATDGAAGETVVEAPINVEPTVASPEDTRQALVSGIQNATEGMTLDNVLENANIERVDFDALAGQIGLDSGALENAINGALKSADPAAALTGMFAGVDLSSLLQPVGEGITGGVTQGIESTAGEAADASRTMGQGAAEAAGEGAQVNSPSAITIPFGEGITEGVTQGIEGTAGQAADAAQTMGQQAAEATATGITGAAGTVSSAIQSMVDNAINAASGAASGASAIGLAISLGMAAGIAAGSAAVIAAAVAVAAAAIAAARAALAINSPSKVTYGFGEQFDKGMELGITQHTQEVVRSAVTMANSVAGAANLTPHMDLAEMRSSVRSALSDFADIERTRDVVLNLNGRELARSTVAENINEQNSYNHRLALNYGRK